MITTRWNQRRCFLALCCSLIVLWVPFIVSSLFCSVDAFQYRQHRSRTPIQRNPLLEGRRTDKQRAFRRRTDLKVAPLPEIAEVVGGIGADTGAFGAVARSPTLWSSAVMFSIVALLYSWESSIKSARETLPETLTPVIDSMLAEIGGLGFIGLFLSAVVTNGPVGSIVESISETFLGNHEILIETFEFLHEAFFEVGVGFFVVAGLTVAKVLSRIYSLERFSQTVFDADGDGEVTLEELAEALQVDSVCIDLDGDGVLDEDEIRLANKKLASQSVWNEIRMTDKETIGEALVVRERLLQTCQLEPTFRVEKYFGQIFGENLEEIVELSPLTWIPLIPIIALGNSIDVSRDIVSSASPNAAESCGYFIGTPEFFIPSTMLIALLTTWGAFNFWKVTSIKNMLLPTLVRDSLSSEEPILLPPKYQDPEILKNFDSSPSLFGWVESLFVRKGEKPVVVDPCAGPLETVSPRLEEEQQMQDSLFGVPGSDGPEFYRNSIKFHAWVSISQIVFWGFQIVLRDVTALMQGTEVGIPDLVLPEALVFGTYVAIAVAQLQWLIPQTFLNFCVVTSIETMTQQCALDEACCVEDECDPFY